MKINLQNPHNTKLHGGPAVFTTRLLEALQNRGYYGEQNYKCWMNLGFRPIPASVNQRKVRLVMRFDGTWNFALWPFHSQRTASRIGRHICRILNRQSLQNIKAANALIFQSNFSQAMLENLFGPLPNVPAAIIQNGVDIKAFTPLLKPSSERNTNSLKIIVSHKHWVLKRSWLIPDIIAALPASIRSNTKVRVLGSDTPNPIPFIPTPLAMMKRRIRKQKMENIFEFRGHIEPRHLPHEYRWADIMLNLSFADPCPNVVVEALACGLPVVGPASGGLAELVDEKDWLVDSGEEALGLYNPYLYRGIPGINAAAYAKVIENVSNSLENCKIKAREKAERRLNINAVVEKYIAILAKEAL